MRILLLSASDLTRNPRARALAASLAAVGHDVVGVCGGSSSEPLPHAELIRVPSRTPQGWGRLGWLLRRVQPAAIRRTVFRYRMRKAASRVQADLIYPINRSDLAMAVAIAGDGQAVFREPHWPDAGPRDLVALAPHQVEWSSSPAGTPAPFYTQDDRRQARSPAPGRHAGRLISIAAHRTPTTPANYLAAAAERAGIVVAFHDRSLDWDTINPETEAVVIVESPYPAIDVKGENRHDIPVLFWVHHGEHHLNANLELTRRYGAHAVLMAHSWHLAHRFPVPTHRFPFGAPHETDQPTREFISRKYDVAMIGAGVTGGSGRYNRRQWLVDALSDEYECFFAYGIPPLEMLELYRDARIVLNEGGDRHHPITMRVFESSGSGALLLTDPAPGLDLLFDTDHYATITESLVDQVGALLADPGTAQRAAAARRHAHTFHLYDHRIDDLLDIAEMTDTFIQQQQPVATGLAALISDDLDVIDIAVFGSSAVLDQLTTRVIWDGDELHRVAPQRLVDAVVIGSDSAGRIETAIEHARRYAYVLPPHHDEAIGYVADNHPEAVATQVEDVLRIDLCAPGYRLRSEDHPLGGT